jgi:hypothetical protein
MSDSIDEKEGQLHETYPNEIEEFQHNGHGSSSDTNTAVDSESLRRQGCFGESTGNAVDVNGK